MKPSWKLSLATSGASSSNTSRHKAALSSKASGRNGPPEPTPQSWRDFNWTRWASCAPAALWPPSASTISGLRQWIDWEIKEKGPLHLYIEILPLKEYFYYFFRTTLKSLLFHPEVISPPTKESSLASAHPLSASTFKSFWFVAFTSARSWLCTRRAGTTGQNRRVA